MSLHSPRFSPSHSAFRITMIISKFLPKKCLSQGRAPLKTNHIWGWKINWFILPSQSMFYCAISTKDKIGGYPASDAKCVVPLSNTQNHGADLQAPSKSGAKLLNHIPWSIFQLFDGPWRDNSYLKGKGVSLPSQWGSLVPPSSPSVLKVHMSLTNQARYKRHPCSQHPEFILPSGRPNGILHDLELVFQVFLHSWRL